MGRKSYEELNELKKQYKTDRLWSWSRYHKYRTSPFEYYLTYISDNKPDRETSIYGSSGGFAHEILEKYYKNEINYDNMASEYDDMWVALHIAELKFDRSNEEKNAQISNKYYYNLKHFFTYHNPIKTKVDLERFIIIKVGNYIFQGYIDLCRKDDNGNFVIQDWKTSSIYLGAKAIEEAGQLILYAEGLKQMGVPLEKIKICWNFVKYVSISTQQANGKENVRQIERSKIGESLKANAKMWLKKCGYEDQLDEYLSLLVDTNSLEYLPKVIQEKYTIDDCYVFVELTEELIENLKEDIIKTLNEIVDKEKQYKTNKDIKLFWDSKESVEKQSYYFSKLCAWSANLHLPYKEYLENLKAKEKSNIFGGIGSELTSESEADLDWINNL